MAEAKTRAGGGSVEAFLALPENEPKRAESLALIALMSEVTGEKPVLWSTMVGFGRYGYTYPSGNSGESFLVGFAPRKTEFSIYLTGLDLPEEQARREMLLSRLGKHRMGKACLYVKRLSDIDLAVLREMAEVSVERLRLAYPQK